MPLKTTPFDAAEYLETDEDIKIFLRDAAEDGNAAVFLHALNTVARAKGMSEIARKAGLTRSSLYKALAEGANPRFETISKVTNALGCKLAVV